MILCISTFASGQQVQQIQGPDPQAASVTGSVTDVDEASVPGATLVLDGPLASDHRVIATDESGGFAITGLRPAVAYTLKVSAKGFAVLTANLTLKPGEALDAGELKLKVAEVSTEVEALSPEQAAIEEVAAESHQRILGIVPNYYVVYDHQFSPMSTKLKYKLALKATFDPIPLLGAMFLAGIDQAHRQPDYVEGMKGYGQRVGAEYANASTNVMIGGAVLPSLLHQDPRYFYQGTGTTRSRLMHALSAPFLCRGDSGKTEFNFSAIGGDLSSASLANIYYPPSNRGPGLVFSTAAIASGGRVINTLMQEFLLSRYTTGGKP